MMRTRLISALDGMGVALAVNVGSGVNVGVIVAVAVGVRVTAEVAVKIGVCVGMPGRLVGVGAGGRELPQILGRVAQPLRTNASRKTVRRFRGISPTRSYHHNILP